MLSRSTIILSSIVALAAFSACSNRYADVYSFKKNSFKAPAPKIKTEVPPPAANTNPLQVQPGAVPDANNPAGVPGVPGVPAAEPAPSIPGIPGL